MTKDEKKSLISAEQQDEVRKSIDQLFMQFDSHNTGMLTS
jgi:hypothetical protein